MKVNPLGIQSYQQLTRREQQQKPAPAEEQASREIVRPSPENNGESATESSRLSRLAVKGPGGSYADYLSSEERQALDLLFSRFRDTERFGQSYRQPSSDDPASSRLGQIIDIKV